MDCTLFACERRECVCSRFPVRDASALRGVHHLFRPTVPEAVSNRVCDGRVSALKRKGDKKEGDTEPCHAIIQLVLTWMRVKRATACSQQDARVCGCESHARPAPSSRAISSLACFSYGLLRHPADFSVLGENEVSISARLCFFFWWDRWALLQHLVEVVLLRWIDLHIN